MEFPFWVSVDLFFDALIPSIRIGNNAYNERESAMQNKERRGRMRNKQYTSSTDPISLEHFHLAPPAFCRNPLALTPRMKESRRWRLAGAVVSLPSPSLQKPFEAHPLPNTQIADWIKREWCDSVSPAAQIQPAGQCCVVVWPMHEGRRVAPQ